MPTAIDRVGVQRLVDSGAQLVEVLPADEYNEEHLPGAINISLKTLTAEAVVDLDADRPIVVYCWDEL